MVTPGGCIPWEEFREIPYTHTLTQSVDVSNASATSFLAFVGSGTPYMIEMTPIEPPSSGNPWIEPLGLGYDQLVCATQSAFYDNKCVISNDMNHIYGNDCLNYSGYNVDAQDVESRWNRAFIGVA